MVSNQQVMKSSGRLVRSLAGLGVLALALGCQTAPEEKAASTAEPVAAAESAPAAPDNAIDAAIAAADAAGGHDATETASAAPAPVLNPTAPLSYTVKRGDTLWGIAAMYLRDPWLWPEIWHVNPRVQNPHLIYPGDTLTLAYGADGRPQITVTPGSAVRVSPLIRSTALDGPIASIPFEAIAAFLGKPSIVSEEDLHKAPHIAAFADRHVVAGSGTDFYVKGLKDRGPGRYSVVHVGDQLKDPETGKVLGYLGLYTGSARVDAVHDVSKAEMLDSARETYIGDLLFDADTHGVSADIVPRAPPAGINGQIMAVIDGTMLIGQYHVVAVNRGSKNGLEVGHVLAIDQKGEVVADQSCKRSTLSWCIGKNITLPDERAGTLLIFKTYDRMSYGLIVGTTVPVHIADYVRTP